MKESCPHCKMLFDAHCCIDDPDAQPKEGDVGVCFNCGGWWEKQADSFVEFIPPKELLEKVTPLLRSHSCGIQKTN